MSRAIALPGAEFLLINQIFLNKPLVRGNCAAWGSFFLKNLTLFCEQATCLGQLRCQGQDFFQKSDFFLKKPLVQGNCAAGDSFFQKSDCFKDMTSTISKHALSETLGARFAEQNVGNLKNCSFRNSGTPVRRTRRRKSQKLHFQEFCDSCAQNKTSESSENELSGILRLLCAEQDVGNLKTWTFRSSGTPVRSTRRRKSQSCTFRNSGTPVRRTRRRKSKQLHFQEFWGSCAHDQTQEISTVALSGILGFLCAEQDVGNLKTALSRNLGLLCAEQDVGNLKNALSGILGLLCASQNVRNLNNCTFRNSRTPARRTRRGKSQKMHF